MDPMVDVNPTSAERKLSDLSLETASTGAPTSPISLDSTDPAHPIQVVIGTSSMATADSTLVSRIAQFSGKSEWEVRHRLAMGDEDENANRVMHIASLDGVVVGWCSSTPGWGGWGGEYCGHWGALAVDAAAQGKGVASALVKAAEKRLLDAGCDSVQIEYRYIVGNAAKERLYDWYEGKLGFDGGPKRSGFRCCHKALSLETFQKQHEKGNTPVLYRFDDEPEGYHEAKRVRASSASTSSSSSVYSPSSSPR